MYWIRVPSQSHPGGLQFSTLTTIPRARIQPHAVSQRLYGHYCPMWGSPLVEPSIYQASIGIGPSPSCTFGRISGVGTVFNRVVSSLVYMLLVLGWHAIKELLVRAPHCCEYACLFVSVCVWAVPQWHFWKASCSHLETGRCVWKVNVREQLMGSTCWRAR